MSEFAAGSPTVTIFADHGPLVNEIADEIRARGAATHTVSIEAGWIDSISRALVVLDSAAGMSAVRSLCDLDSADAHVVALLTEASLPGAEDCCDRCADRHDIIMLRSGDADLVGRVVDEVVEGRRS